VTEPCGLRSLPRPSRPRELGLRHQHEEVTSELAEVVRRDVEPRRRRRGLTILKNSCIEAEQARRWRPQHPQHYQRDTRPNVCPRLRQPDGKRATEADSDQKHGQESSGDGAAHVVVVCTVRRFGGVERSGTYARACFATAARCRLHTVGSCAGAIHVGFTGRGHLEEGDGYWFTANLEEGL
jgi:hypothetical protein